MSMDEHMKALIREVLEDLLERERPKLAAAVARQLVAIGPTDEYLTPDEAGRLAKVEPQTIRDWIAVGRLHRYSAGRALRVKRSELEALLTGEPEHELSDAEIQERTAAMLRRVVG